MKIRSFFVLAALALVNTTASAELLSVVLHALRTILTRTLEALRHG